MNENLFFNFLELFFVNEKINFIFKRIRKSETDSQRRETKEMRKIIGNLKL